MQDLETGSLWSHITGKALLGKLAGARLKQLPAEQTTWKDWQNRHPNTRLLKKEKEIKSSRYEAYFADPNKTGIFRAQWLNRQLPAKKIIFGLRSGPFALAVTPEWIRKRKMARHQLGEEELLLLAVGEQLTAFLIPEELRAVWWDLHSLTGGWFLDESGGQWQVGDGACISGPNKGKRLFRLPVTGAYWFAWNAFYPNTGLLK